MAHERHTLRAIVVQTLFAWEFRETDPTELLTYNLINGAGSITEKLYAYQLFENVLKHRDQIRSQIEKYAPEWTFEKISRIDRAVLEVAIAELLFDKSIPDLVAINEGIEMAKEFGTENSSKFVNGVLSSIYDDIKNEKS